MGGTVRGVVGVEEMFPLKSHGERKGWGEYVVLGVGGITTDVEE